MLNSDRKSTSLQNYATGRIYGECLLYASLSFTQWLLFQIIAK